MISLQDASILIITFNLDGLAPIQTIEEGNCLVTEAIDWLPN